MVGVLLATTSQAATVEALELPELVRRADRIVWVNKDLFPHTVTSDTKAFDSHDIPPSASWTYRADRPGDDHGPPGA